MKRSIVVLILILFVCLVISSECHEQPSNTSIPNLLPIVDPNSNCSGHGNYTDEDIGVGCECEEGYIGRICEIETHLLTSTNYKCWYTNCYDCQEYDCNNQFSSQEKIEVCPQKNEYHIHAKCTNITVQCFLKCEQRECPEGIGMIASSCFHNELRERFIFFIIVMAVLTVISIGFELATHKFEHYLDHHHMKGVLSIIHSFKSELMLIGLIGLSLFIVHNTEAFEHLLHYLTGSMEIIEGVHFLVFFFVVAFLVMVVLAWTPTLLYHYRSLDSYETKYFTMLQGLIRNNFKLEEKDTKDLGALYNRYWRSRELFEASLKLERPNDTDSAIFFPFSAYVKLCMNDLIAKFASSSWLVWIIGLVYFYTDIYLGDNPWFALIPRSVLFITQLNIFIGYIVINRRLKNYKSGKNEDEENRPLLDDEKRAALTRKYYALFPFNSPKLFLFSYQLQMWLMTVGSLMELLLLNDGAVLRLILGFAGFFFGISFNAAYIAALLNVGPNLNMSFVKEVEKRQPREANANARQAWKETLQEKIRERVAGQRGKANGNAELEESILIN